MKIHRSARPVAAVTALVIWAALCLQFAITAQRMTSDGSSLAATAWRFFGYFTILSNLLAALVSTALAVAPNGRLAGPRARLTALVAMTLVGIVYSIALRSIWNPQGWQAVADHALHDAAPLLFLLTWLSSKHGGLSVRDIGWALSFPLAYCLYALSRGAFDGRYAYWFLDASALAMPKLAANILILLLIFVLVARIAIAADGWLARRGPARGTDRPS